MRLSDDRRRKVVEFVERVPWGDVEGAVATIDEALQFLLPLTSEAFENWEERFEAAGDEFELATRLWDLDPATREALIARMIRNVALMWGIKTEFGGRPGEICRGSDHAATPGGRAAGVAATGGGVAGG